MDKKRKRWEMKSKKGTKIIILKEQKMNNNLYAKNSKRKTTGKTTENLEPNEIKTLNKNVLFSQIADYKIGGK